jgi:peptidoglycan/LPS O-acetylase OafA/YrhL
LLKTSLFWQTRRAEPIEDPVSEIVEPPVKAARVEYYDHLDALRGIAALIVVLVHVQWINHVTRNPFIGYGAIFVDFFFVLSGIVISHVYARIPDGAAFGTFMRRRLARVYPLHLATLLAMAAGFVAIWAFAPGLWHRIGALPQMHGLVRGFFLNLFLLNAHNLAANNTYNVPSWSLGAEMTSYIVYGVICTTLSARRNSAFAVLALATTALLIWLNTNIADWQDQYGVVRGILGFSLGCLTYAAWVKRDPRPTPDLLLFVATMLVVAAVSLHFLIPRKVLGLTLVYPFLFAGMLYLFMRPGPRAAALLRSPPLRMLGWLSYSIYMIHFLLRWVFGTALTVVLHIPTTGARIRTNPFVGDALLLAFLVLLFVMAWVSYTWFESPIRRRFH